ncbi:MAG: hypothetical protein KA099_09100 [Alphaproteobacteria bacterium]|nr:hypothetical protein [Alphaproteobacteria bacterium]MBP7759190.1 hypothetical protein [Alphaproteobacteria bacterium]MBP7762612.1 hypothetical protein [Alphaproteobacteria bacterium]MBP7905468.1 hypothetical protein [Alphaproteobacteria bacterium]
MKKNFLLFFAIVMVALAIGIVLIQFSNKQIPEKAAKGANIEEFIDIVKHK